MDLEALWKRLGVKVEEGRVRFDDGAPLAALRRAWAGPGRRCGRLDAGPACRTVVGPLSYAESTMFTLSFKTPKSEASVPCENEVALLPASRRAQVELTHRCGGHARCGTCLVTIEQGQEFLSEPLAAERRILEILKAQPNQRLACQAWARGDVSCSQG